MVAGTMMHGRRKYLLLTIIDVFIMT